MEDGLGGQMESVRMITRYVLSPPISKEPLLHSVITRDLQKREGRRLEHDITYWLPHFSHKGPNNKCFAGQMDFVTIIQLCFCGTKAETINTDEWTWLYSNNLIYKTGWRLTSTPSLLT
jgi:hypothetical protein